MCLLEKRQIQIEDKKEFHEILRNFENNFIQQKLKANMLTFLQKKSLFYFISEKQNTMFFFKK